MKLLISAGEASGDLHGARLLAALRRERPDLERLRDGGGATGRGGSGARGTLGEPLGRGHLRGRREASGPARGAQAPGRRGRAGAGPTPQSSSTFPTSTACSRAGWRAPRIPTHLLRPARRSGPGGRPGRGRSLERARRILTLFPFETEIFRRLGADAVCVGHPVVEDVREGLAAPSPLPPKTRRRLVLLPGSRARRAPPPLGSDGASGAARLGAPLRSRGRRRPRARPSREPLRRRGGRARHPRRRLRACTRSSPPPTSPSSPRARPRSKPPSAEPRWSSSTARRAFSHAIARALVRAAVDLARQHRGGPGGRDRAPAGRAQSPKTWSARARPCSHRPSGGAR